MKQMMAALVAMAALVSSAWGQGKVTTSDLSFMSGGKEIKVERYSPVSDAPVKRPAVIVLHGSDGFVLGGLWYKAAARRVAEGGYETYLVHYFNRTGDWRVTDEQDIHAKVPVWTETTKAALDFVAARPEVDAARIGIVGVSLGGALAMMTAADEPRIKAMVDYYGFVPKTFKESMKLPPTLIIHGTEDGVVWVSNSTRLDGVLTRQKVPHELKLYEGEGHGFRGKAGDDADARAKAFLARYLKP